MLSEPNQSIQQRYYPPSDEKVCIYRVGWMKEQGFKLHRLDAPVRVDGSDSALSMTTQSLADEYAHLQNAGALQIA